MGVVPVDAVVAVARWVTPRIVISSLLPTIIRFSQVKIKVVVWPFFFLKFFCPFFFENPKTYMYDEDPKLIKEKKRRVFVFVCFGFWTDKEDSKKRPTKQRKANKRGA